MGEKNRPSNLVDKGNLPLCSTNVEQVSLTGQGSFYPASRGQIFAEWAGVRKVTSDDNRSIFYRACAKFFTRFASKINRHGLSSNGASFPGIKKLPQLWSATQNSVFCNLFVQISERLWAVVGRGYFSHDSSQSENEASAHTVGSSLSQTFLLGFADLYLGCP